jgi:hypothetical protein
MVTIIVIRVKDILYQTVLKCLYHCYVKLNPLVVGPVINKIFREPNLY